MKWHLPFVNTPTDLGLLKRFYPRPQLVRVKARKQAIIGKIQKSGLDLWVDCGVDGLHRREKATPEWHKWIAGLFPEWAAVLDSTASSPLPSAFTSSVLEVAAAYHPKWLSIPQVPHVDDGSRNNLNRLLAKATRSWADKNQFDGKLILPVILTHRNQTRDRTSRRKKIDAVKSILSKCPAYGIWVVDSNLDDHKVSGTSQKYLRQLIDFHTELNTTAQIEPLNKIVGPYWGLNLVLWARKLSDFYAIGIGVGHRYYVDGGVSRAASARIALEPLRRRALYSPELRSWLDQALAVLSTRDPAYSIFAELSREFEALRDADAARTQVASFYATWIKSLEKVHRDGRALALYQDLSSAYILGKKSLLKGRSAQS